MKRWTNITLGESGIVDSNNDFERTGLSIYGKPTAVAPLSSAVLAVHK